MFNQKLQFSVIYFSP